MSAQMRLEALKLASSQFDDTVATLAAALQYTAYIEGGLVPKVTKKRKPRKKEDFKL